MIALPFPITQKAVEFDTLLVIYEALKPMHVLEIGSEQGGTLYHWVKHAPAGATIVNVDILQNQGEEKRAEILARWKSWGVHTIASSSHLISTHFDVRKFAPFDFLFLDGDHTYEGVKQDWEWYGPLVRKGGVVAFHDLICPGPPQAHIQVGRLFKEIKAQGYKTWELYSEPVQTEMGIGVVYV